MSRQMHFVAFLMTGPTSHHHGMWRHPETENRFLETAWWETLARTLENGKFDAFFFADALSFYNETVMARGGQMSLLDPVPLAAAMSRVTEKIGIGVTLSTSFVPPYGIARQLGTLDLLSGGRIAWNVVTSASDREAHVFGFDALPPRAERYDRAEEVLNVCLGLWSSWSEGALVIDKQSGVFIDKNKVRPTHIDGKWASTKGVYSVPPSAQGRPVIMQAGSSPRGRDFAAQYAEMIFTLQHSLSDMQAFYTDIKSRMTKAGRKPEDCAILTSVDPIIGETEAIAREKQEYINSLVDPELAIAVASAHVGVDLTQFSRDESIAKIQVEAGSLGSLDVIMQGSKAENLTLGQATRRFATSELCPQVVGTPESVADQLQAYFDGNGCDGFILTPTVMPGSFEDFTRSVVPILQERGVFRKEYPGSTLRDTLRA
ncbi:MULTISPECIES: LLM class flavin-dependent oxidoreductase [Alphaproteobacteria]|uniref:Monooxygenase n=2 Tax=Alphaproteobacteria TaxID=28211 RepID=A0A512HPJ2_9HYPH|nr:MULTISPECIES: LLM class flavin-dependent oxidoreductase [Alphaproteobacteria]GEO87374.1 monooxygenase [Ciceribacter naphthalenivorans]GLR23111.1 monooxygenase [Ciceribacter naphthalenivorans]GLT05967.1 monooxygenase [Sphingomonas psychrolutea]